jgi:unsaturated rhamnogalacturonyl hydrolase
MAKLVFDDKEIVSAIDRVVERTFQMDFNWD